MRFGKTTDQREHEDYLWFAWYPVRLSGDYKTIKGRWAWLETVHYKTWGKSRDYYVVYKEERI